MFKKMLYFRTEATIGDDDATADSVMFDSANFLGAQPTGDSALTLYFKNIVRTHEYPGPHDTDSAVHLVNSGGFNEGDNVTLNLTTANTHKKVLAEIMQGIAESNESVIVIADDLSGNTTYITDGIADVGTIDVQKVWVAS
jgi:hypothetical protein